MLPEIGATGDQHLLMIKHIICLNLYTSKILPIIKPVMQPEVHQVMLDYTASGHINNQASVLTTWAGKLGCQAQKWSDWQRSHTVT